MNVVAALGSPREQGNTAVLLEQYLKGVMSLSTPVQLKTIYLQSQKIQSCTGCNVCERYEESKCVLKDSMQEIYKQVEEADVLVLATPVYVFHMTGQLKTFLDRLHAIDYKTLINKKIVLLTTYGDTNEADAGVQGIIHSIKMLTSYLGMDFVHNLNISTHSMQVSENEEAKKTAYLLGTELVNNN